jgi:Cytochrome c7 and related cytochrome c
MKLTFLQGLAVALFVTFGVGGAFKVFSQTTPQQTAWEASAHNNIKTTLAEATVDQRQATAAHCARCHSDQGFRAWLPQLLRGDPGNIKGPDGKAATVEHLKSLGLTKADAKPITCVTCHTENNALRLKDSTPMLPSGFAVTAVGDGALCMTCHNTRNGRIQWDTSDPKRYTGPHEAAQTDMIMAKNFFFINDTTDRTSPHAKFTNGSCTTCHMSVNETENSHSFKPPQEACQACHGKDMNKEYVARPTRYLLEQLRTAMLKQIQGSAATLSVVKAYDASTDKDSDLFLAGRSIQSLEDVTTVHGQSALQVKLSDGTVLTSLISEFREAPAPDGHQIFPTEHLVVRAAWNYLMVKYDRSNGVHNPSFSREALLATINALK